MFFYQSASKAAKFVIDGIIGFFFNPNKPFPAWSLNEDSESTSKSCHEAGYIQTANGSIYFNNKQDSIILLIRGNKKIT